MDQNEPQKSEERFKAAPLLVEPYTPPIDYANPSQADYQFHRREPLQATGDFILGVVIAIVFPFGGCIISQGRAMQPILIGLALISVCLLFWPRWRLLAAGALTTLIIGVLACGAICGPSFNVR